MSRITAERAARWRPSMDDVERISRGLRASRRGTGSRSVPHRLTSSERASFDLARRRGFVELSGSGWRRERGDSPLWNTWRNWCDAKAMPVLCLMKRKPSPLPTACADDQATAVVADRVIIDISPLRKASLQAMQVDANACIAMTDNHPDKSWREASVLGQEHSLFSAMKAGGKLDAGWPRQEAMALKPAMLIEEGGEAPSEPALGVAEGPIHALPLFLVMWSGFDSRKRARQLVQDLAASLTV